MTTTLEMTDNHAHAASPLKRGFILWFLGASGVLSLLLLPISLPTGVDVSLPETTLKLITVIQSLIFLTIATVAGTWASERVGFRASLIDALISDDAVLPLLRKQIVWALIGSAVAALVVLLHTLLQLSSIPDVVTDSAGTMPLITRLLYGGITEELLLRWGVMSVVTWLMMRILRVSQASSMIVVSSILIAAILFGLFHLPAATAMGIVQPSMMLLIVVSNALAALIYGFLFWKVGIESAIFAHMLTHIWLVFVIFPLIKL